MTTREHSIQPPVTPVTTPAGHARRSRYVAAAVVVVLGLLVSGAWAVLGVVDAWQVPDDFTRSALPGSVAVQVTDTGTQWLYYEHEDGTKVASLAQLGIRVTAPGGEEVTPRGTGLNMEYDAMAGDVGTAIGTFTASTPGTYTVTADAVPAPDTAFAVGASVAQPLKTPLIGAVAVLAICSLTAVGLVITARRR